MLATMMMLMLLAQQPNGDVVSKENLDLPYDAVGILDEDDSIEVVIFYGQAFEGDGLFYVIDKSGSTNNGKLDLEQREVTRNIQGFSDRVQFGVFFFDQAMYAFPDTKEPAHADDLTKQRAIKWVQSMVPGGGTCPGSALVAALDMARLSTAKRKTIIYLSDGCTSCPGQAVVDYEPAALIAVKAANVERLKINSIRVGPDRQAGACEWFMRRVSLESGGRYTRITTGG